jgi:hypothetical protein
LRFNRYQELLLKQEFGNCSPSSTLEDWIIVGLKLGHILPVIDGIDLNE